MDLFDAMWVRKSVRSYSDERLSPETLEAIKDFIEKAERLHPEIDLQIKLFEEGPRLTEVMSGFIGNFGKAKAPYFLVVTSEPAPGYMENAGFAVEQVVLKLTTLGLGTCWLGGHIKSIDTLEGIVEVPENHKPVVLISFGAPAAGTDLLRKSPGDAKRKPLAELASGSPDETWTALLEAARIAPSAMNSQPSRFVPDGERLHVYRTKPKGLMAKPLEAINPLDMGIALSHIKVAAAKRNVGISFQRLSPPAKSDHIYMLSVVRS
jgi:nitroreductase